MTNYGTKVLAGYFFDNANERVQKNKITVTIYHSNQLFAMETVSCKRICLFMQSETIFQSVLVGKTYQ